MKCVRSLRHTLYRVIVAVASVLGCYGIGHSMSPNKYNLENNIISSRDSLIQEMIGFIQPGTNITKAERRHIECRIKSFTHKVIRRDTVSFFINTAYAVAYYEFYKHDYRKAKRWVDDFYKHGMPYGLIPSIFRYTSVGLSASNSLNSKGKLKYKKDKNSWYMPMNLPFADSLKFDSKRTPAQFIDSFLDDVPMDCNISTYRKLLSLFKDGGGRLEWLNGFSRRGFVQRCVDAGRTDVIGVVNELWNVSLSDFKVGKWGYLEYINPAIKIDSASIAKITEDIISFDPKHNREQIDSLLALHEIQTIGYRILRLLSQYYDQSRFTDIVSACEKYNPYLYSNQLNTLHNYWGLALSNLGRYEDALMHYDIAISASTNVDVLSAMRLNKACALGEMGRSDEAISLFMSEKDVQRKPFDRFVWNDNLGYIYSFIEPTTALYYYNHAEKFLDSSTLYPERKIRHFCRKARMLQENKYLQRMAIEEALKYTRNEFCPRIAKGMAYTELGCFNMSVFNFDKADENFTQAYSLMSELAEEDRRLSYLNLNYAENLCNLNRHDEAVLVLTHLLEATGNIYGCESTEYFQVLCKLLLIVCDYPHTNIHLEEMYDKYIQLRNLRMSPELSFDDISVDIAYELSKNNWAKVRQMFKDALSKPFTPMQRLELCQTYEKASRYYCGSDEYDQILRDIVPLIKADVVNGIMLLTGDERRAMQIPLSNVFEGAISAGSYDIALELSLFRKGLLFATRKAVEQRLAKARTTKSRYQDLVELRQELNSAIEYNDTIHIPALAASVSVLERELSQTISSDKEIFRSIDKTIPMVTSALGGSDIAVDFVRYCSNDGNHYGAFIIDNNGFVKFVDVGTEVEVKSNPNAIWQFLNEDILSGCYNICFSADGFLHNIGLEYLQACDGSPISEKAKLHRVFHLSDIKSPTDLGKDIVAIGVSDHNSPIGEGETIDRGAWTDLPNVKYEMQLIMNTLRQLSPRLLFNDEASETAFKALSGSEISTLHISTHGFFRNTQQLEASSADSKSYDYNIARRFLAAGRTPISGLVLRQGNLSWQSPEIMEEFDDLLTSEEIEVMSFPNLRLTVLSACDTGLGEIDNDGIWGLQRAFRIAGTKSLICSLSKVDDYWTAQFMDAFYEQAVQGNSIYDSFHAAQRWLHKELPENPEIWSSFILIE